MPQMAPMNWLILFIMFIMIFMMFNTFIFHSLNYTSKKIDFKKKSFKNIWKW